MSIQLNTDGMIHEFEKCVRANLQNIISELCEGENLNYVEIVEKYGHLGLNDEPITRDYKPKKTRAVKPPLPKDRCNAYASGGKQCLRSKKDGTDFCRRHKHKRTYGTIHDKPPDIITPIKKYEIDDNNDNDDDNNINDLDNDLEIEHKGNIITLENGTEVIFIPTTGLCYSYGKKNIELLGKLSNDNKSIIT